MVTRLTFFANVKLMSLIKTHTKTNKLRNGVFLIGTRATRTALEY